MCIAILQPSPESTFSRGVTAEDSSDCTPPVGRGGAPLFHFCLVQSARHSASAVLTGWTIKNLLWKERGQRVLLSVWNPFDVAVLLHPSRLSTDRAEDSCGCRPLPQALAQLPRVLPVTL